MRMQWALAGLAMALSVAACARDSSASPDGDGTTMMSGGMMGHGMMRHGMMRANPGPQRSVKAKPSSAVATFKIASVGDTMAFDVTTLEVRAGQQVHVVFHNNATSPALPHNWVLVEPGTAAAVARAGIARGKKNDYVAPGPDVIAHTALAGPGQTVETTFDAPAPGKYPYICTVPGHSAVMKGTLIVDK